MVAAVLMDETIEGEGLEPSLVYGFGEAMRINYVSYGCSDTIKTIQALRVKDCSFYSKARSIYTIYNLALQAYQINSTIKGNYTWLVTKTNIGD